MPLCELSFRLHAKSPPEMSLTGFCHDVNEKEGQKEQGRLDPVRRLCKKQRQEDKKFNTSLGYGMNVRPP